VNLPELVTAVPVALNRPNHQNPQRAAQLLMLASGFAGLGYQIVWTQQCALWLGHEAAAVLAVVAAFFGGLAVGALVLGQRIEASRQPLRWYAGCELVIALWSLVLALTMAPVSTWLLARIGVQPSPLWQWTMAFFGTFFLLLPATAAMGATLPAMERITAQLWTESRSIAALYACNTLGAVIGVLAIAFWLIPTFGLLRTAAVCIALNLLCGVSALRVFPSIALSKSQLLSSHANHFKSKSSAQRAVLIRLALTGLLGIGYEVLVVRVLSQVAEDTVYTFAMLLAVYLVGSAIGAVGYQRWLVKRIDTKRLGNRLLSTLATACLLGTASLWAAEQVKTFALHILGASMASAIAAETILAVIAFGPPTIVMGALFSYLSATANAAGVSFGRALGVNTLGAAMAPVLFGVVAFPLLGPKLALLLICGGYLALSAWQAWLKPWVWIPATTALALAIWAPPLAFIDVPDGGHVVSYQEGVMAAVSVVEDADGVARLRIDNRQQEGSSSSRRVDARQAMLPILLHAAPQRVLFLGLGTGVTASAAAEVSTLEVDAVELLPEVISASHFFSERSVRKEIAQDNSRLHLIAADARRYVRASDQQYDVIISDNFHPARSGSGSLYTVEHFAAVRARLAAGGVFCQWLPLHQLDLATLRHIVQSFLAVYPNGFAILASNSLETPVLGLVGKGLVGRGDEDKHFDVAALSQHLASLSPPELPRELGVDDEFALLGSFVAGPSALRHFAGDARANTDDFPIVAYRAPRITYAPDSQPRDRLIALLRELSIEPDELIEATSDQTWSHRLSAYWAARNRFIEIGRDVRPSADVRDMLAQVREPLLSVLRISPDFRPAYDPLLMMASSLLNKNAAEARALLIELVQVQPARPEAALMLEKMSANHL
jgi:spermidine synthase